MHRRVIYTALAWAPMVAVVTAGDANTAYASTSPQVIQKTVIYEPATTYAETPAEIVTVDKWFNPLSTPVSRRPLAKQQELAQAPHTPFALAWAKTLDAPPTRLRGTLYAQQGYSYLYFLPAVVEEVTVDKWYVPLDLPVRRHLPVPDQQKFAQAPFTPAPAEAPGNADLGFVASSWQVANRTIVYEPDAYTPFTPAGEVITADKWWRQLDVPVRRRFVVAEEGSICSAPPRPEANDQTAWHRQLDWPVRRKVVVEGAYSSAPPLPEANDATGWHKPLGEPVRVRRPLTAHYQFEARAPFPVVPWGWYAKLDEPMRLKKSPAFQVSLTFVAAAPSDGTAYNWFLPLETPTRARKLYEFPATAIPVYFVPPTPGAGFELNWWPPLNEPVRPKRFVAQQQGLALAPRLLTTTLENAWYVQLTDPVERKSRFNYSQGAEAPYAAALVEIVTVDKWWTELARPVRRKVSTEYRALAQGNINPVVPFARSSIDEPRRIRPRFNVSAWAWGSINPVVPFAHTYLHTPHRQKGRIDRPALAQGTINPATVEVGKFVQWWRQLDLPVREWRQVAWQHFISVPPTGVSFFVEGGPADEPERVVCVPPLSRVAVVPLELREADVPLALRVATVPEEERVAVVPLEDKTRESNDHEDAFCAPFSNEDGIPVGGGVATPTEDVLQLEDETNVLLETGDNILLE